MLGYLIFAAIPVLLYELVKYLSEINYKKKIRNSISSEIANENRLKIKKLRVTVFTIYWIIYAVLIVTLVMLFIANTDMNNFMQSKAFSSTVGGFIWTIYSSFFGDNKILDVDEEFGNIEVYSKDEIINYRFSFYLRAFEQDSHTFITDKMREDRGKKTFSRFQEYEFCKAFEENDLDLFAIGNPKEVDAPQGARRIYVNHDKWQEDVKDLIAKCQMLFILMSSRDSCIWEIEQTPDYLDKTVFLVDNLKSYEECIKRVEQLSFPHIEKEGYHAIYKLDNKWQITEFENSMEGYQQLASHLKSDGLYE